MVRFLEKIKSLKHIQLEKDTEGDEADVLQTPSDASVRRAEAMLDRPEQGILPSTDVIQSPTSLEVQEAEASIKPPLARRPSSSSMLLTSLSRKILGPKSLHASHDDFSRMDDHPGPNAVSGASRKEGSLTERLRSLTMSKSQPDLRSAASEGMSPTPEIVVLGREARSKSRRFMLSEDGSFNGTASWQAPEASVPVTPGKGTAMRSVSSGSALYSLHSSSPRPVRSPFSADELQDGGTATSSTAAAHADVAAAGESDGSPAMAARARRRVSRKISQDCKLIVSTEPLQENPGDIMLTPETVEFAWSALADSGGHRTEEIQFSGKSARVARRLSRPTTDQEETCRPVAVAQS